MTFISDEQRFYSVDKGNDVPFEMFYSHNQDGQLTQEDFQMVYDLKVNESLYFGMGVEVKRTR